MSGCVAEQEIGFWSWPTFLGVWICDFSLFYIVVTLDILKCLTGAWTQRYSKTSQVTDGRKVTIRDPAAIFVF